LTVELLVNFDFLSNSKSSFNVSWIPSTLWPIWLLTKYRIKNNIFIILFSTLII